MELLLRFQYVQRYARGECFDQHAIADLTISCAVSEDIIKSTADIMVDSGLKKAGYEYLVIDGMHTNFS